jgi:hypothetical protein
MNENEEKQIVECKNQMQNAKAKIIPTSPQSPYASATKPPTQHAASHNQQSKASPYQSLNILVAKKVSSF